MTHLRAIDAQERLLTREELADRWSVSPDTVDRMRADGLPEIRWGRRMVRFRYSDCVRWLEGRQEAA